MNRLAETEHNFQADDGLSLFYRHRSAANESARLVIAHGLGEHSGRYAHVMDRMADAGISVWAMDHRGHGRSEGRRGHVDTIDQYVNDFRKFVAIAGNNMPEQRRCFLLGHSMGGLIVLRCAEIFPDIAHGVIASSPGLNPGMRVPLIKGTVAKILSRIWPALTFDNELNSDFLSHDTGVVTAYTNDPLVHRSITARWFTEFLNAMAATRQNAANIQIPVLMQVAGDDRLVDPETSRQFFKALTVKDKTLHFYDRLFHEIYNETATDREKVLNDLDNWLASRI
jgi:alpha-beta hydrolase superfamily lysophospholipase